MIFGDNKRRGYLYNIGKTVLAHTWATILVAAFVGLLCFTMY